MRKFLGTCVVLFLIFYAVTNPTAAASGAHAIGAWLGNVAHGVADFFAAFSEG